MSFWEGADGGHATAMRLCQINLATYYYAPHLLLNVFIFCASFLTIAWVSGRHPVTTALCLKNVPCLAHYNYDMH